MVIKKILSPAKINLMLRVTGQRSDGYHLLQTCFQLLNWGDDMTFKKVNNAGSNALSISGFEGLDVQSNLIHQAAMALKPWAQDKSDWLVEVEKKIPLGAGLGGGSSNAATTLKFLNQAWQCDLNEADLLRLGSKLGADVPVFIKGKSALAEGIGDKLTSIDFDTTYILLLFPESHINTAELFKSPDLVRSQSLVKSEYLKKKSFWINDFMPVVLRKFSQVEAIYSQLNSEINLRLSGTGSTLFAVFDDLSSGLKAQELASEFCVTHLVQPLDKVT